jgi:transcriptional regulator with XRE-family HTH domain
MEEYVRTLKEIRQEKGIGIRRLSKGAPVAPRTIYGIERGQSTPQPDTIRRISRFLNVDPMQVSEFKAALEELGLDGLPEEEPQEEMMLLASPGSPMPAGAGWREEARDALAALMRDLGRVETIEVYREVWGEQPPE